jgi:hypothetical protein
MMPWSAASAGFRDKHESCSPGHAATPPFLFPKRILSLANRDSCRMADDVWLGGDDGGSPLPEDEVPMSCSGTEGVQRVDLADLDEAIVYLERNLEYLKSCPRYIPFTTACRDPRYHDVWLVERSAGRRG